MHCVCETIQWAESRNAGTPNKNGTQKNVMQTWQVEWKFSQGSVYMVKTLDVMRVNSFITQILTDCSRKKLLHRANGSSVMNTFGKVLAFLNTLLLIFPWWLCEWSIASLGGCWRGMAGSGVTVCTGLGSFRVRRFRFVVLFSHIIDTSSILCSTYKTTSVLFFFWVRSICPRCTAAM